jgi:hypothetical protein
MNTQNILLSSDKYDIAALVANVTAVRRIVDFGAGAYEHSLSLPSETDIEHRYRSHRNNIPYADALNACPLFAEIFHKFKTAKASFRLLYRKAGTAYSLHDDRDMGDNIVRLQMPVITNDNSLFLLQKDNVELEPIARRIAEIASEDKSLVFDFPRLVDSFGEWFDLFLLEPGYFNLIKTDKVHSLVNAGQTDRITLAIDLLRNKWLDDWLSEHMTGEISAQSTDSLPDGIWEWGSLRHGLLTHPRIQLK